ncbi:MAG: phosphoheptose isomerase [Candidatus Accumulibacter sp.]|jgi:D-sedoheptulose 7-phosphate isomerase|nr:phosphoheptose isomerase [Accumulibacter sp.]
MDLIPRIRSHFKDSAQTKLDAAETLVTPIARASECIAASLSNQGKVLACGNGGSAADAQHFAAELVGRFERERRGLAAIALTTDTSILTAVANDYSYGAVFARQVSALGKAGDVLLAISTSGNSPSIVEAIRAAQGDGIRVVALTGRGGGKVGSLLMDSDVHLCVPSERTPRIQEIHLLAIHCLCDAIDCLLLGASE